MLLREYENKILLQVNKKGLTAGQLEEHIVSIIASLVKACSGTQKQRILSKFTENDHEKVKLYSLLQSTFNS